MAVEKKKKQQRGHPYVETTKPATPTATGATTRTRTMIILPAVSIGVFEWLFVLEVVWL
jgi:hypothetical protein